MDENVTNLLLFSTSEALQDRVKALLGGSQQFVTTAFTLEQHPAAADLDRYDVVLLDVEQPEDLVSSFLSGCKSKAIILVSQEPIAAWQESALQQGAADYLPLDDVSARGFTQSIRFAIERHDEKQRLVRLAYYDSLTELANRSLFNDRLKNTLARAQRESTLFALLYIDLNGFKQVNDRYGHAFGDKLIMACAGRLVSVCRRSDSIARLGGDEFIVLLPTIKRSMDVATLSAKIISALSEPFQIEANTVNVGCSIGIAIYPDSGSDVDTLMRHADIAMYQAKMEDGSSYHFFTDFMGEQVRARLALESQLRKAIRKEEFCLHYQPRVNCETGEIRSLEALIRWRHPERGMLLPQDFLTLAEESRLVVPMGYWVIEQVCRDLQQLKRLGIRNLKVSINLSVQQFKDSRLVERCAELFRRYHVWPGQIELELKEQAVIENQNLIELCMLPLIHLGCRFVLDNFGASHSTLQQLQSLPFSTFKVDRRLVEKMPSSSSDKMLVNNIIEMGRLLDINVVADGVEQPQQTEILKMMGCKELQGYLYCEPVDIPTLSQRFDKGWRRPQLNQLQ